MSQAACRMNDPIGVELEISLSAKWETCAWRVRPIRNISDGPHQVV